MSAVLKHLSGELQDYLVQLDDFEMGELIGKGAFGEVFKAVHKKTQKVCAVKKLFATDISDKDTVDFCREVAVLARCDGMFLTPFMGWQATVPLLIVTEFIPKGSLFAALRHRPGSPTLTGTHKTVIALGVAKGMATLHEKGIIHRDLKSLNVLLDDRLLPCICDFGVSRFAGEAGQLMTKDVGTPHWMAPELFMSQDYTNKVDVYAYAILLWEMLTETVPFKGKSGVQIALAVCQNRERPAFPGHVPKPLKQFISACWHQDPEKRPSFDQIVKVLSQKKVMFAGTNPAAIDFIRNEMREYAANHSKQKSAPLSTKEAPIPQKVPVAAPAPAAKANVQGLRDVSMDEKAYKANFERCVSELNEENVEVFFENLSAVYKEASPAGIIEYVNEQVLQIIQGSRQYLDVYVKADLHHKLPLATPAQINSSFDILLFVTTQIPASLDQRTIDSFSRTIKEYGLKMINVMYKVLENFDRMENRWIVADRLIGFADHFLVSCPLELIRIFNYLLLHYSQFYSSRYEYVVPIIVRLVRTSQDVTVLSEAYGIMVQFYVPNFVFEVEILEKHFDIPELRNVVMCFIMKQKGIHINESLMRKLLALLPVDERAFYAILCSCDRTNSGDSLVHCGGDWMTNGKMASHQVASLLLVLLCYPELRNYIGSLPEFPAFLAELVRSNDENVFDIAETFLVKVGVCHNLMIQLSSNGFLSQLFTFIRTTSNANVVRMCIYIIDSGTRLGFVNDYLMSMDWLLARATEGGVMGLPAVSALASLCMYPEAKEKATQLGVVDALNGLRDREGYNEYISVLLSSW